MNARTPFLALTIASLLAACGSETLGPTTNSAVRNGGAAAGLAASDADALTAQTIETVAATSLTMGPLVLSGIDPAFRGPNWHFRDAVLTGPVTGDLAGTALVTLNANLDALPGSGPAWGTVQITTSRGEIWAGSLSGYFVGAPDGIQLFSRVVLHGPNEQTLRAECDETSAPSEIIVCIGTTLAPHG